MAARRRAALRGRALDYKGGRCKLCGYDKCASALEFHHVDPLEKDFSISDRMTSFEAIQAELDKTVLLCANCHREVHEGFHPGYLDFGHNEYGDDALELDATPIDSLSQT